jgi:hypothetical protein
MRFKRFEWILALLCILALVTKLLKIYSGNQFALLFLVVLGLSYCFMGWYLFSVKDNGVKQNNIAYSIITGIFLQYMLWGIAFKVFSWPMCRLIFFSGLFFTILLLSLCFILLESSTKKLYYTTMIKRLAIICGISILIAFLPVKNYDYDKQPYKDKNGELVIPEKT